MQAFRNALAQFLHPSTGRTPQEHGDPYEGPRDVFLTVHVHEPAEAKRDEASEPEPYGWVGPPSIAQVPAILAEYVNISLANRSWTDFVHDDPDFIHHEVKWAMIEHAENLGFNMRDLPDPIDEALTRAAWEAIRLVQADDETRTKVMSHAEVGEMCVIVVRHRGELYTVSACSTGEELITWGTIALIPQPDNATHVAIQACIAETF